MRAGGDIIHRPVVGVGMTGMVTSFFIGQVCNKHICQPCEGFIIL